MDRATTRIDRRRFLQAGLAASAAATPLALEGAPAKNRDMIDCHTHFYDPTRPQGVPWPPEENKRLYRRVLPPDYQAIARPHGVTGTVVVEASAWLEDNQWILDLAKDEPFIVGFVGRLTPGEPEFAKHVERFAANPLYRGIRVSGGRAQRLAEVALFKDLKVLADHDLSLDVNGGASALPVVAKIAEKLPALRIVINHVANVRIDGGPPPKPWLDGMRAAAGRSNVFLKVSGLVEGSGRRDGTAPKDVEFYRHILDAVWKCFGEDRLIYGSNWPVSEMFADFATVHGIVRRYFATKGEGVLQKYFAENARRAYKWLKRER